MDQTMDFETFKNFLFNAVQSHNQANRMQGEEGHFSILNESGIMGDPGSAVLLWTDPKHENEGYCTAYKVEFLYGKYLTSSREDQRTFFTDALVAVSSGVALDALQTMLRERREILENREYLLKNVFPAVIQYEGNESYLDEMPNRSAGMTELRIYYYVRLIYPMDDGTTTEYDVPLTNEMLENANKQTEQRLTEEILYQSARDNIAKYTKVEGGQERIIRQICEQMGMDAEEGFKRAHPPNIELFYYITTPGLPCGAAAAFTFCGINEVESKWQDAPAYFIPTSMDEVCVRIVNGAPGITQLANDLERETMQLPLNEQLSNSIYYYDPRTSALTVECQGTPIFYSSKINPKQNPTKEQTAGIILRGGR